MEEYRILMKLEDEIEFRVITSEEITDTHRLQYDTLMDDDTVFRTIDKGRAELFKDWLTKAALYTGEYPTKILKTSPHIVLDYTNGTGHAFPTLIKARVYAGLVAMNARWLSKMWRMQYNADSIAIYDMAVKL